MRLLIAFIAGALLGVACTFILLQSAPSVPDPRIEELRRGNEQQSAQIEQQRREISAKNDALHRLQSRAASAASHLAAPPPPAKPENQMAGLAKLMDNPAMKKMMAASQQKILEDNYGDFIDELRLSPEERAKFVELLAAKQGISMNYGLEILKASPKERRKIGARMKAEQDKSDADIREFLNSDADYASYQAYTEAIPQRMQLQGMQPAFARINQPLTAEQQKALLALMQKESHASPPAADPAATGVGADENTRTIQRQAGEQARVAAGAAAILTPQQLEVFTRNQASTLQMMKASLEMSHALLGDDPAEQTPAH